MKDFLTTIAAGITVNKVGKDAAQKAESLETNVTSIINNIVLSLGLVCVIVIIIGGVNYMTSNGDTSKVEKGKKTILYGAIGLVICVLAFAIVNFVISGILKQGATDETTDAADGTGLITDYTTINSIG